MDWLKAFELCIRVMLTTWMPSHDLSQLLWTNRLDSNLATLLQLENKNSIPYLFIHSSGRTMES